MFSLFKMPKMRTFGHFLTSSEDKLFFVKKEDVWLAYLPMMVLLTKPKSIIIISSFTPVLSSSPKVVPGTHLVRIHLVPSAIALTPSLYLVRSAASSIFNPTFFTLSSTGRFHAGPLRGGSWGYR